MYEYRYAYKGISYISPPTPIMWSFEKFAEAPGIWKSDDGQSFECKGGDSPPGSYGIGCSEGFDDDVTIMPLVSNGQAPDVLYGKGSVCQKSPNYWSEECPAASFYFRCHSKWMGAGKLDRLVL